MQYEKETAEERFRAAFERLKENNPTELKRGTPVSQNNVAKEAGKDPSALRKNRHGKLIADIQAWVSAGNIGRAGKREEKKEGRLGRLDADEKYQRLTVERDFAQSQLVSAHRQILELLEKNAYLQQKIDELLPPPIRLRPEK